MDVQGGEWLTEARVLRAEVDLRRRAVVFHFDSKRMLFVTPDWVVLVGYEGDLTHSLAGSLL